MKLKLLRGQASKNNKMHCLFLHVMGIFAIAAGADWTPTLVAKLSHSIIDKLSIPCALVLYPATEMSSVTRGDSMPIEVYHITREMTKVEGMKHKMLRVMPMVKAMKYFLEECPNSLYVLLAWLPGAKRAFQQVMESSDHSTKEANWLIFLPKNETRDEFVGESELPLSQRFVFTSPTQQFIILREVWRVASGHPLNTVFYATWSEYEGLTCKREQCLHYYRDDLLGYPIIAATKEDMPLSSMELQDDGSLALLGFFGDVYYEIVSRLNATPIVVPARENVTGFATDGQWNGLLGMLQRNEIDLAVGPLSVQKISLEVVSFARPLLRTNYQVFFKQSGTVVEWDAFLRPFAKYVWRIILLWIIVAATYLNVFYYIGIRNNLESKIYRWEFTKINSLFTFMKALCHQGTDLMPSSLSCRVLYLTGYMTFLILQTAYSGALISKLTTQEPLRPFDSLETFLQDGSYKLTAIGSSTDYTYFSEAVDPTLKSIYERLMLRTDLPTGKEEGLMAVCNGERIALFITFAVTQLSARQLSASRKCPILFFKNPLGIVSLTIGIRKKMPFISLITQEVQAMAERGILKRLQNKEWPPYQGINSGDRATVEITQVAQIHAVLLAGVALSLIILLCEILHATQRAQKIRRRLWKKCNISSDCFVSVVFLILGSGIAITIVIAMK